LIRLHPEHPLRHRAAYNRIEAGSFPSPLHPELASAQHPTVVQRGLIIPDAAVRARNLEQAATDPRYLPLLPGLPFVRIPSGTFTMGGSPALQPRELPTRRVRLTQPFLMAAWPVTRRLWNFFRPGTYPGRESNGLAADLPAVDLLWDEVTDFCVFLSRRLNRHYRLPTEAEWEFCCRAGTTTPFHFGQTISTDQANYNGNDIYGDGKKGVYREKTTSVGSFPANAWGLHDMHGNVWQWCQDWFGEYPQKDMVDPQGPEKGDGRVLRGGSWGFSPKFCRSADRLMNEPGNPQDFLGCRVCFFVD
jgi:formylglycine-generating enzyme required for sulfatase activity